MKVFSLISAKACRRGVFGAIAIAACLMLVADPIFARGRFGGGGGHGGGGMRGGGGFSGGGMRGGGGFSGGGMRGGGGFSGRGLRSGGDSFDRSGRGNREGLNRGGLRGGDRGDGSARGRERNPDNVDSRQDGRSDRTDSRQEGMTDRTKQRNKTAQYASYNRAEAWEDSVDHWGGYNYWGHDDSDAGWFAAGMLLGMAVTSLPPKHETVVVYGTPYYYVNGVYYVSSGTQYVVAPAPVGAVVEHPPAQVTNVYVNGENLGYSNGAYYQQESPAKEGDDPSYKVVAPPVGATVQTLPKDAKETTIDGIEYYEYAGTYYQVFHSGSKVVYMVVKKPTA